MTPAEDSEKNRAGFWSTVIWTGALAGTLDGLSAVVNNYAMGGKNPGRIFQYIASGVFGKETAYAGGATMVGWGIFFHYVIAYASTVVFFLAYPKLGLVTKNKILVAIGYGFVVWAVMNLVVVPLSGTPKFPFGLTSAVKNAVILMVCIGLPLSLSAHRFFARK